MSSVVAKSTKKGFTAPVLKPQVTLSDKEYEDIFSAVLSKVQGSHTHSQQAIAAEDNLQPETTEPKTKNNIIQGDEINKSKKIKKRPVSDCKFSCVPANEELNKQDKLEKKTPPRKRKKLQPEFSPWGSHFHKQPSNVSSSLKEMVESQNSLIGSSAVLSPSSSDDECAKSSSQTHQLSNLNDLGNSSKSLHVDQRSKLQQLQKLRNVGVWVYCCRPSCQKQRYLADITDPQDVPEVWYCHMNPDPKYNSCQCKEQELSAEEEADMIYNEFTAGSLVWARVTGFPWWPAMVDDDPDLEQYYWLADDDRTVTFYHVVFFDESTVTRAWVSLKNISPYTKHENKYKQRSARGINFSHRIMIAKEQANDAITLTTAQRLSIYSFIARYKGPIITSEKQVKNTTKKNKLKVNVGKKEANNFSKINKGKKDNEIDIQDKTRPQISDFKKKNKSEKLKKANKSNEKESLVGKFQQSNNKDINLFDRDKDTLAPVSLVEDSLKMELKTSMLQFSDKPAKKKHLISISDNSEGNQSINEVSESDKKQNSDTNVETPHQSQDMECIENKSKLTDNFNEIIIVPTEENKSDTLVSLVGPSQISEMQDLSQESIPSQSTIADIFKSENENAVVPESCISDQSQPFEE